MKNYKCDVAVVGAGAAGLSAAIAAAEKGASVIVLEKSAVLGGIANKNTGLFAVESAPQKRAKVAITREAAYGKFMEFVHFRVDPHIVREYIVKSPDTIRWLEAKGAKFTVPVRSFSAAELTWVDSTAPIAETLISAAKALNIEILTQTAATELIVTDGKVTGVKAGDEVVVAAGAVIVAAGGFAGCGNAVRELTGYVDGETVILDAPATNTGDGLKMSWAAGAGKSRTILKLGTAIVGEADAAQEAVMRQPNLLVNVLGRRIMDEEVFENTTYAANELALQSGMAGYMITGQSIVDGYKADGLDVYGSDYSDIDVSGFAAGGAVVKADTVEELAEKLGIESAEVLAASIEEYNAYAAAGLDGYFGKSYHSMKPIEAPYYGAKFVAGADSSLGGTKVNWKLEAINEDFEPIPGLYAAGNDCCNIFDDSYISILPGSEMGFAVNSGRMAGERAADYAKA